MKFILTTQDGTRAVNLQTSLSPIVDNVALPGFTQLAIFEDKSKAEQYAAVSRYKLEVTQIKN